MASFHLSIGGMTLALACDDPRIDCRFHEPVSRFAVAPSADVVPDLELVVRAMEPADDTRPSPGSIVFDSGAVWRLLRDGDDYLIECRAEIFGERPYKIARLNASFTRGTLAVREGCGGNPLNYPLDEVLVANLLGRGRGVELHGCGIVDRHGRGHLYVGQSGAGKTTTANLWGDRAADIVSDDRVIVRMSGDDVTMYGTPWHGEARLASALPANLDAIYLLTQATYNELRPLDPAEAVARLFACTFPPFYDGAALAFTIDELERLVARVPVRELRFTRDAAAVELVLEQARAA